MNMYWDARRGYSSILSTVASICTDAGSTKHRIRQRYRDTGINEERSENKQRSTDISMTYGLASGLSTL